ncbi:MULTISPECIES: class I adenylate-forming enzyme family protein [unclassified Streptomyces]|uniref:class I adenylate-forming enzyme family protein n=1 Tax=unclassified Streptomyces TaxID=2593676 RepID=UPI0037124729
MTDRLRIDLAPHHRGFLGLTIPEALDLAADRWGAQLAIRMVEGEPGEHTWSELRELIARVRSGLEAAGVAPGDKIGIMLGNQIEFPLSWLAVIEAGAVAVPLNPKYTAREVDFVLGDAGARWLIAGSRSIGRLREDGAVGPVPTHRIVAVGDDTQGAGLVFADLLTSEITPRTHKADPLDVVNIQFTSGTTGLPKGCLLTHEYWVEFGVYSSALFDDPQRLLADHPFYYMQNQAYFMIAMAGGGALCVTAGLSRRKFMGWLVDHRIDFAWLDDFLLDEPERATDSQLAIRKSPMSEVAGSAHAALEARFGLQARDWYASTEAGNGTFVPWERTDLVGRSTIGLLWPTREAKIIDADGNEVAPGAAGELCLRGSGMMLGYHNRPEANAELLLPGGWYRTGDLVRRDSEGLYYFEGRIKDMVKRSGENISCAEVEMRLLEMAEVAEAGVIPVPDPDRGEEVKAILVLKEGTTLPAEAVAEWCRQELAAFKVPRYVEFRAELPHTSSGKVAKSVLRAETEPFAGDVVDLRAPARDRADR